MKGIKLTIEQKEVIQGQFFNGNCFFNCVQDINNDWFLFLSQSDKEAIVNTKFAYLLSLPEEIYTQPLIQDLFNH